MELLKFIFSSFWIFIGFVFLIIIFLALLSSLIVDIINTVKNRSKVEVISQLIFNQLGIKYSGEVNQKAETISKMPKNHRSGELYKVIEEGIYLEKYYCVPGDGILCIRNGYIDCVDDWVILYKENK